MPDTIVGFRGAYSFLSNFYPAQVGYAGLVYPTVEHAYQAGKTTDPEIRQGFTELKSAATAKSIGDLLPRLPDEERLVLMKYLVDRKFSLDTTCGTRLLETDPLELIEGNWWHDNFWGQCHCQGCLDKSQGKNWLGRLLMMRRTELGLAIKLL